MQVARDIKIYPFDDLPGYLLLFSGKSDITLLIQDTFYHSMKTGNLSAFDEAFLLMNKIIVPGGTKALSDVRQGPFPEQEVEYCLKKQQQAFLEKFQAPYTGDMTAKIDNVIVRYFPDQFRLFTPPAGDKITISYRNIDRIVDAYVYKRKPGRKKAFVREAFFAIAGIRYVDNFIDDALWPGIKAFDVRQLSESFINFLKEWLETVREYDPEMPDEIVELFIAEMALALDCSQEYFDRNFERLFDRKSLDIFYAYQKIHKTALGTIGSYRPELLKLAIIDYIRDFYAASIEADTDLSLYKYIRDNKLRPRKLIDYLIRLYARTDPVGSIMAAQCILPPGRENADPLVVERHETGIPLYEPFPRIFAKAISLLNQLEPSA